jgi:excisionase family DNA binding protein
MNTAELRAFFSTDTVVRKNIIGFFKQALRDPEIRAELYHALREESVQCAAGDLAPLDPGVPPGMITYTEAAAILGVGNAYIRKMVCNGTLQRHEHMSAHGQPLRLLDREELIESAMIHCRDRIRANVLAYKERMDTSPQISAVGPPSSLGGRGQGMEDGKPSPRIIPIAAKPSPMLQQQRVDALQKRAPQVELQFGM